MNEHAKHSVNKNLVPAHNHMHRIYLPKLRLDFAGALRILLPLGLAFIWAACNGGYIEVVEADTALAEHQALTDSTAQPNAILDAADIDPGLATKALTEEKPAQKPQAIAKIAKTLRINKKADITLSDKTLPLEDKLAIDSPQGLEPVPEFEILHESIKPGHRIQLHWNAGQSFSGRSIDTPVLVLHGARTGPVLCLTAAVHGDELNGVEIVRRIINETDPKNLAGTIIGVPIVNLLGLARGSRYLPDRRDLNRYFPGYPEGSVASRIAYLFFERVIRHCQYLVDFHTGSAKRSNLPQLRADLNNPAVRGFTQHFGATAVLHHPGSPGMLRWAASTNGIPAVTFELGEPSTLQPKHVEFGVKAIDMLMQKMKMIERFRLWSEPQPVYYASRWIRANRGGIMITATELGAQVGPNEVLGWVTDPLTNDKTEIRSQDNGRVLGMALNQFVLPGFAAFHIGIEAKETGTAVDSKQDAPIDTELESELSPIIEDETSESDFEREENRYYD